MRLGFQLRKDEQEEVKGSEAVGVLQGDRLTRQREQTTSKTS